MSLRTEWTDQAFTNFLQNTLPKTSIVNERKDYQFLNNRAGFSMWLVDNQVRPTIGVTDCCKGGKLHPFHTKTLLEAIKRYGLCKDGIVMSFNKDGHQSIPFFHLKMHFPPHQFIPFLRTNFPRSIIDEALFEEYHAKDSIAGPLKRHLMQTKHWQPSTSKWSDQFDILIPSRPAFFSTEKVDLRPLVVIRFSSEKVTFNLEDETEHQRLVDMIDSLTEATKEFQFSAFHLLPLRLEDGDKLNVKFSGGAAARAAGGDDDVVAGMMQTLSVIDDKPLEGFTRVVLAMRCEAIDFIKTFNPLLQSDHNKIADTDAFIKRFQWKGFDRTHRSRRLYQPRNAGGAQQHQRRFYRQCHNPSYRP